MAMQAKKVSITRKRRVIRRPVKSLKQPTVLSPDKHIFDQIALLKVSWTAGDNGSEMGDDELTAHLEKNYWKPYRAFCAMRPKTIEGALARLEFFKWESKVALSDDPIRRGMDSAIADLKAIVEKGGTSSTTTIPRRDEIDELRTMDSLNDAIQRAEAVVGIIRDGLEEKASPGTDDMPNYSASDLFGAMHIVLTDICRAKEAARTLDNARMERAAK